MIGVFCNISLLNTVLWTVFCVADTVLESSPAAVVDARKHSSIRIVRDYY